MQIPLRTISSVESYVAKQEWRAARLSHCPLHPRGGCSFARHGSYERATPPGLRIARWYCPEGRQTFSLLPDFLAARLPGLLASVDHCIRVATSSRSIEAAADALRGLDVTLPSAVRWLRRRMRAVFMAVDAVTALTTQADVAASKIAFRLCGTPTEHGLQKLRVALSPRILSNLPPPLGFRSPRRVKRSLGDDQHDMGPDGGFDAHYAAAFNVVRSSCNTNQSMPAPRPPPRTFVVSGSLIDPSTTGPRVCISSGSGVFAPTAHKVGSLNEPS